MDKENRISPARGGGAEVVPASHQWASPGNDDWCAVGYQAMTPVNMDGPVVLMPTRVGDPTSMQRNGVWHMEGAQPLAVAHSPATGLPSIVINNHLKAAADAQSAAHQRNSQASQLISSVKVKLRQALGNPLVAAAVGAAATLLMHNRLPGLKHIAPNKEQNRKARDATASLRRVQAISREALEDCHDVAAAWREHARRSKPLFQHVPEPDSAKCNIRSIMRALDAAGGADSQGPDHGAWMHRSSAP